MRTLVACNAEADADADADAEAHAGPRGYESHVVA